MDILFSVASVVLIAMCASLVTHRIVVIGFSIGAHVMKKSPKTVRVIPSWPALNNHPPRMRERVIGWAGLTRDTHRIMWACVAGAGLILFFLLISSRVLMFLSFVAVVAFLGVIQWRASTRKQRCIEQIPDAMDALSQALRAGYAIPEAIALVARESHEPVSLLFDALSRAHQFRLSLHEAARYISYQIELPDWELFMHTLRIHHVTGGNLVPVLSHIALTLRDKVRMEHEAKTATAAGKFSGLIIASLAPISFLAFYFFVPEYVSVMVTTPFGIFLLCVAVVLEVVGFMMIWSIVTVAY